MKAKPTFVNSLGDKIWTFSKKDSRGGVNQVTFARRVSNPEEISIVETYFPRRGWNEGGFAGAVSLEAARDHWTKVKARGFRLDHQAE